MGRVGLSRRKHGMVEGITSEPECVAEGGAWDGSSCSGNNDERHDVDNKIYYDLRVELYKEDPGTVASPSSAQPVWWETIYMDEDAVTVGSLENDKMYLGMIPVGWWLKVEQSYHMPDTVGNKFQGDTLGFVMELYAEQLTNTVVLENKYDPDTDLSHHVWSPGGVSDGKDAVLSYKVMDREFAYDLAVNGMSAGEYSLIAWEGADHGWDWNRRDEAIKLADVTVTGDPTTQSASVELDQNLVNAKVWLIPGTYVEGNDSTFGWNEAGTLFETGLMDYYDADL